MLLFFHFSSFLFFSTWIVLPNHVGFWSFSCCCLLPSSVLLLSQIRGGSFQFSYVELLSGCCRKLLFCNGLWMNLVGFRLVGLGVWIQHFLYWTRVFCWVIGAEFLGAMALLDVAWCIVINPLVRVRYCCLCSG